MRSSCTCAVKGVPAVQPLFRILQGQPRPCCWGLYWQSDAFEIPCSGGARDARGFSSSRQYQDLVQRYGNERNRI